MRIQTAVCVLLFVGFLAAVEVQTALHLLRPELALPEPRLGGVVKPIPRPVFSLKSWWDGRFQEQVEGQGQTEKGEPREGWIDRHVGFRSVWIKTDNQINFSLFRELPTHAGPQPITLGKDNWLYEDDYVNSFIGFEVVPKRHLQQYASYLKELQDDLQKRNITMLLVVSPSKAAHYPEYLPDWTLRRYFLFTLGPELQNELGSGAISPGLRLEFADRGIPLSEDAWVWIAEAGRQWLVTSQSDVYTMTKAEEGLDVFCQHDPHQKLNYDVLMPLLDREGVNYVDAVKLFRQQKKAHPEYRLFPRGGTHWTYYGAGLVAAKMLARLKEMTGKDIVQFTCESVTVDCHTTGTDNDLGDVLNIWTPWVTKGPTPHPRIVSTGGQWKPNVLWVGDSFSWTLTELMDTHRVYSRRDMLFAFGRKYSYPQDESKQPAGADQPIDAAAFRAAFDWPRELAGRDILILETNEARLSELGYYFLEWALVYFRSQRPQRGG